MMKIITGLLVVVLSATLIACTNNTPAPQLPETDTPEAVKNKQSCLQQGGKWLKQGRGRLYGCLMTAKDAGKTCTDSQQCEYRCLAKSVPGEPVAGQKASGQCQATSSPFGCHAEISGGIVLPALCVD